MEVKTDRDIRRNKVVNAYYNIESIVPSKAPYKREIVIRGCTESKNIQENRVFVSPLISANILVQVLNYCDAEHTRIIMMLCRASHDIIMSSGLRMKHIEILNTTGTAIIPSRVDCYMTDLDDIVNLHSNYSRLTILKLRTISMSSFNVIRRFSNLHHLVIGCVGSPINTEITDNHLHIVAHNCSHTIISLKFIRLERISEVGIAEIFRCCVALRNICIFSCPCISSIANDCQSQCPVPSSAKAILSSCLNMSLTTFPHIMFPCSRRYMQLLDVRGSIDVTDDVLLQLSECFDAIDIFLGSIYKPSCPSRTVSDRSWNNFVQRFSKSYLLHVDVNVDSHDNRVVRPLECSYCMQTIVHSVISNQWVFVNPSLVYSKGRFVNRPTSRDESSSSNVSTSTTSSATLKPSSIK